MKPVIRKQKYFYYSDSDYSSSFTGEELLKEMKDMKPGEAIRLDSPEVEILRLYDGWMWTQYATRNGRYGDSIAMSSTFIPWGKLATLL